MKSLGVIGECMLELRADGENYRLGYGGDVFNTAVYATRLGLETRFFSATGDDHYSAYLLNAWAGEGVDTSHVRQLSGMKPSLYIIAIDSQGERSFQYWREASPFRHWLRSGQYRDDLFEKLRDCDCLYFSSITLALLPDADKTHLLELLKRFRAQGGTIGFDPNYRAGLWPSADIAANWVDAAYQVCDFAMPSADDEALLRENTESHDPITHIQAMGAQEVVLKRGAEGVTLALATGTERVAASTVPAIADTTAAGDAFNAGYLYRRLQGADAADAAALAVRVAATVIQHPGAIIPADIPLVDP